MIAFGKAWGAAFGKAWGEIIKPPIAQPSSGGGVTFYLPRYNPADRPARQKAVEEDEALLLAMIY